MKYTQTLEETQQNQIDINNQFPVDSSVLERKIEFQKLKNVLETQQKINERFPVENSILEQKIELQKLEESLFIQDFKRIENLDIIFNPI